MEQDKDTVSAEAAENTDVTDTVEEATEVEAEAEQNDVKSSKADKKKMKRLEAELADAAKKLADKEVELSEQNDKYYRMMAEYDNFRKRSTKEKDGIYADAYADAIKNILPVLDNLERASAFSDAEAVSKGVEMTLKGALEAFEKMGVTSFGEIGDEFDPNKHNAVMHIEDESVGEGIITAVFQRGYAKGDKIIRYAMVTVAN